MKETLYFSKSSWGVRHRVLGIVFIMNTLFYALRFNLSLGIVAMVDDEFAPTTHGHAAIVHHERICPELLEQDLLLNSTNSDLNSGEMSIDPSLKPSGQSYTFSWDEKDQGLILGSFFWGYVCTQLPGGLLALKYGSKWIMGFGMLSAGILGLAIPYAAMIGGKYLVIVARILQGFSEGFVVPALFQLVTKWTSPEERAHMSAACFSGMPIGAALTMIISGQLITTFGWPAVFYVPGILTVVWFALWTFLGHSSPDEHPSISQEELNYIKGVNATKIGYRTEESINFREVPWRDIVTSGPIIVIFISQFTNAWGHNILKSEGPKYLHSALHFDIHSNSYLSAAPDLCQAIFSMSVGKISDIIIEKKYLSMLTTRKICNTIGQWGSALAFAGLILSGCYRPAALFFYICSGMINGAMSSGVFVNMMDISPSYSGAIEGVINSAANIAGFGAPYVVGLILFNEPTLLGWHCVFLIPIIANVIGNLAFLFGASEKVQKWDRLSTQGRIA